MRVGGRRGLAVTLLLCAAGAVLVLLTARATWAVEVTARPAPFPAERVSRTGGDLLPWLPALAWLALAGAGALLATRGAARRLLGGLLVLAGAGITVLPLSAAGGAGWRVLAAAGGLAVAAAGVLAVARSREWPAMGARYERGGARSRRHPDSSGRPEDVWDALDRGEDPTR